MPTSHTFAAGIADVGKRLDQFLTAKLADMSRSRVQLLIEQAKVLVNGNREKASYRLSEDDAVEVQDEIKLPPLRAMAEEIPLDVIYEDESLAVINKPAGMMVHAGAGDTDAARNRGTLVNGLLHHFAKLSSVGGETRPGIVHRLDKGTSGLILVAKSDAMHRKLAEQFSSRQVRKTYIALVHGWPKQETGTIQAPIGRDRVRRTRMTTHSTAGRDATSHFKVLERIDSAWGKFSLLEVRIETGRTHQIRVHLASIGHPVAGDSLYGAPRSFKLAPNQRSQRKAPAALERNFLHAAGLQLVHPRNGKALNFSAELPPVLKEFLAQLRPRNMSKGK